MPRFEKKDMRKIPLRHDFVIGMVVMMVIKTILRYLLMAAYLIACDQFGLYDYGFISKVVVTLTSICASRWIMREIGRMIGDKLDEPLFEDIGIVACVRGIKQMTDRW